MARGGALLLALALLGAMGFRSEKILSDMKRCGDPECERLMLRAQATRDYTGPDCRYLSFKSGQEILVYYKLSGKRSDLWQGSQGMKSGYFPKDAVGVEEVYLHQEMEVPSKETDFICLDGGEYVFENEDSVLHNKDEEFDSLYHDLDLNPTTPEGELLKRTTLSFQMGQRIDPEAEGEEEITTEKAPNIVVETRNAVPEPVDIAHDGMSTNEDTAQLEAAKETWSVSGFTGWLGLGGKQEESVLEITEEPLQENTFHSRKIALSNDLSSSEREEQEEPSKSGWFQSRFTDYLPFVAKDTEQIINEPDKVSNSEMKDHAPEGESDKNTQNLDTNPRTAEQEIKQSDSQTPESSWFSLGFDNVFNLGQIVRGTINTETEQMEEYIDRGSLSESAESLNPLETELGKDQDKRLNGVGLKGHTMQNEQANPGERENLHQEQTTPREINMSENDSSREINDDLVDSSWFNLGLDKMMSFRVSQADSPQTDEKTEGTVEEPSHISTSRDTDLDANLELANDRGGSTGEHLQEDEARKMPKESVHLDDLPNTAGWFSNNLENILNLKVYTATDETLLSTTVTSKDPSSEADSVASTAGGQIKESAETREILNAEQIKEDEPGEVPEKVVLEKRSLPTESSSQNDKLLEQLNNRDSEDDVWTMVPTALPLSATTDKSKQLYEQDKRNQIAAKETTMSTIQSAFPHRSSDTPLPTNRGTPKDFSPEIDFQFQHLILSDKNAFFFEIIQYLQAQNISSHMHFIRSMLESTLMAISNVVVKLLPEDLRPGPDLYGVCWEMVICAVFVGVFTVTLFLCQVTKAIRSRLYVGREKELASEIAKLMKSKCEDLERLSVFQRQYDELGVSLKNASDLKEASEATSLEAACEKLTQSNAALGDEIEHLEMEMQEEGTRRLQQDDILGELQRHVDSLEKEVKDIRSQTDEARTTLKVFQINKGRLETALQDVKEEHVRFQESNEQLLKESEGWGERLNELSEQTKLFESSKQDLAEALKSKESQVKSLTDCLLTMKDWSTELGAENSMDNNNWEEDIPSENENGKHLDDHQKRTVKKLIHAAKLNASLKTLEAERHQIYIKLADEVKAKEEIAERIDELHKEQHSLHSENAHFESDVQNLQEKLKVMTEMYQENELKLHRKLTVEEKERLQKEEKLSKVDEKIYHAAEELQTYKTRAKDLEEELERTIRSYQSQICSHEKKGHDNWLAARAAERHLNDMKKENAHNRQKLTELQFNVEFLEKEPYALEVPRGFARENSPFGPPPLGRPSPESRAFLSPPTLLDGPLRLSPMLPGAERAGRSPGDNVDYSATTERAESGSDHQGANSDTGSLSPPWERERRISAHLSGQHYPDPVLLPRRHDRYFPNPQFSGRFSGPAELLRGYNMQSLEKSDGQLSEENRSLNESSRNGADESRTNLVNVEHQPHQAENVPVGLNFGPPPPQMRGPLMPVDPRGPFLRRMLPFPPRTMDLYGGPREYFPVPDFAAIPRHPMAMRNPFPARPFYPFSMQRPGFFPPPPDIRNESPPGGPEAEHPKPHQETEEMLRK